MERSTSGGINIRFHNYNSCRNYDHNIINVLLACRDMHDSADYFVLTITYILEPLSLQSLLCRVQLYSAEKNVQEYGGDNIIRARLN